jgi:predicted transcriptional regulator
LSAASPSSIALELLVRTLAVEVVAVADCPADPSAGMVCAPAASPQTEKKIDTAIRKFVMNLKLHKHKRGFLFVGTVPLPDSF